MSQLKARLSDIDIKTWISKQSTIRLEKKRYPAKPQLRNHHWFMGGILVLACSWVSIKSTASINADLRTVSPAELSRLESSQLDKKNTQGEKTISSSEAVNSATNLPVSISNTVIEESVPRPNIKRIEYIIKRGDTLGSIFAKMGLSHVLPHNIVNDPQGKKLKNISVGRTLVFELTDSQPTQITYGVSALRELVVKINPENNTVNANEVDIEHETTIHVASTSIDNSLFLAASNAGVSDTLIMDMAAIFGWDIDFVRDIRKGDHFTFTYEKHEKDGKVLSEGNIIAAEFVNRGEVFSAVRFTDSNGDTGYYTPEGKSMKGTFLKSPMKFSRISSGFTKRRFHPVLKKWRAHKGVDYAAGTGTPIRTTANGKISFIGRKGGYGRVVIINHGGKYSTLYAHMSRFKKGLRSGGYVKQGQTIGYVGKSGLATGPHLHYEFRVSGVHRNPLTYKTPKSTPIAKKDLPRFKALASTQLAMLRPAESEPSLNEEIALANKLSTTAKLKTTQDSAASAKTSVNESSNSTQIR